MDELKARIPFLDTLRLKIGGVLQNAKPHRPIVTYCHCRAFMNLCKDQNYELLQHQRFLGSHSKECILGYLICNRFCSICTTEGHQLHWEE